MLVDRRTTRKGRSGSGQPFTAPLAARSDRSSQTLVSRLSPDVPDAFGYANGNDAAHPDLREKGRSR
ncbi:hypothetical protein GCM10011583_36140 [Streptomyces camponoticapitis]|uniref:Uncharacterized protein n=1 Tax=Streptomyces camponoticapitis TaxID=1616125 RepID=A0ABQ2E8Y4_9ACTN|nr:hypothetical protein GCM10011583_36140 [Streptomyces camponoticapitis]